MAEVPTIIKIQQNVADIFEVVDPSTIVDGVFVHVDADGTKVRLIHKKGRHKARNSKIRTGAGDMTTRVNDVFAHASIREVIFDDGPITVSGTIECQGKKITFQNDGRLVGTYVLNNGDLKADIRDNVLGLGATLTNMRNRGDYISVKWFGAEGSGAVNDQPPCQKAVDTCINNVYMSRTVKFMGGETYRFYTPLIAYKWTGTDYSFFTCNLCGEESAFFANGAATGHAVINMSDPNTFAIGYQVCRSSTIKGLCIRGGFSPTFDYYNRLDYIRPYETWSSSYGFRDTFHSPNSGIVFDPFRNTPALPPDGGYPGMSAWYRGTNIGSGCSAVRVKDCEVSGFTVDIMCSPNGVTQNCEDIHVEDCRLEAAKIAYCTGQDQIKNNTVIRCVTWDRVHTLMDTRSHGWGTGLLPNVDGWNIASGSIMRIWNIDTPRFPASLRNIFGELLFMLGDGDGGMGMHVSDCEFGFNTYGPPGSYMTPEYHVKGGNIKFTNCAMRYYDDAYNVPLVFYGHGFQFDSCFLNMAPVINNPYQNNLYYGPVFKNCRSGTGVIGWDVLEAKDMIQSNPPCAYGHFHVRANTYASVIPGGAWVVNGVRHMNYVFDCGSYLGYKNLSCCFDWVVDDYNRKITITGLGARHSWICVGDYITDEDTNFYYGIVQSVDRVAGSCVLRNVPVNIGVGGLANAFGIQWVRRISGHFIGDVTSGSNQITNCEFDTVLGPPHPGTRLGMANAYADEVAVEAVVGSTVYLTAAVDHTKTGVYFTPGHPAFVKMESFVSMYYDPPFYTQLGVTNGYPHMFAKGCKVYTETTGGPSDQYPTASEWVCTKPGFLQAATIPRINQAEFKPVNEVVPVGIPDQVDSVWFKDSVTGRTFLTTIETLLDLALPRLVTPGLAATVIAWDRIQLDWTDVADEVSYRLEVSPNGTTGWVQIGGTIAAGVITYLHLGLSPLTAYYYRIRAIGDSIAHSNSVPSLANGTTPADTSNFPHISTFNAADGTIVSTLTPTSGAAFTDAAGTFEVIGNKARPKLPLGAGDSTSMTSPLGATQDYKVTVKFTILNAAAYGVVTLRYSGSVGLQMLLLTGLVYGTDIAAGYVNFAYLGADLSAPNTEVKFIVHGALLDTYVNGVLIDPNRAFNAGNNGTLCGLGQINYAGVGIEYDDFKVEALP